MGDRMGKRVGPVEGAPVGLGVKGICVGALEGQEVGRFDCTHVGIVVGSKVGQDVNLTAGLADGQLEGV